MNRKSQIKYLFDIAENILDELKLDYERNVKEKNIDDNEFKTKILFFLICLRVILDYIAKDIADNYAIIPTKKREWIKFPICLNQKEFLKPEFLNELKKKSQLIYDYLLKIQPIKENNKENIWIWNFNELVNNNKHDQLSPHIIKKTDGISIGNYKLLRLITCNGSEVQDKEGNILIPGNMDVNSENVEEYRKAGKISKAVNREQWDSIHFVGIEENLTNFLDKVLSNIKEIEIKIYKMMDK